MNQFIKKKFPLSLKYYFRRKYAIIGIDLRLNKLEIFQSRKNMDKLLTVFEYIIVTKYFHDFYYVTHIEGIYFFNSDKKFLSKLVNGNQNKANNFMINFFSLQLLCKNKLFRAFMKEQLT